MPTLTKDADKLLCCIYKIYLERLENKVDKDTAKLFELNFYTTEKRISSWSEENITDSLDELENQNMLETYSDYSFILTASGIVYLENRFSKKLAEVLDYLSKIF